MAKSALVLIGQIAAGKTTTARALAQRTGARVFCVEDVREPGRAALHILGDTLATTGLEHVILECSGTTADFEGFLARLDTLGYVITVVKLVCSIETAYRRIQATRSLERARGGSWPVQLRWVEQRLRAVPAEATLQTDAVELQMVTKEVETRWCQASPGLEHRPPDAGNSFSFSRLSTFERCPLAYQFRYVEQRPARYRFQEELVGRLVHAGLAQLYRPQSAEFSLEKLLASVSTEASMVSGLGSAADLAESVRDEAIAILRQHYARGFTLNERRTLAVEKRFEIDLGAGLAFVGTIDRLIESQAGIPVVIDYKTSTAPHPAANIPDFLQLEAYGLAAQLELRAPVVEIRRHYLRTGTEEIGVVRQSDISRIRLALRRWIRRVTGVVTFPPRPTKLCSWCTYNNICPSPLQPMRTAVEIFVVDEKSSATTGSG